MTTAQLRLTRDATIPRAGHTQDPTRQVFERWVTMFGRHQGRTKLGPTRRQVIDAALTLYDVETLLLAIDGMAADPLADCANDRIRDAMREIEWLLARESRIERWADRGEALHRQLDAMAAQAADAAIRRASGTSDPAEPGPADDETRAARAASARALAKRLREWHAHG